ncbi:hypothetical protein KDW88_09840 [Burkholderia cenocepacia]|nr:hypothetical protein [Burkholderia cenocepacia]
MLDGREHRTPRQASSARSIGRLARLAESTAAHLQQLGHRIERKIGKPGDRQHHAPGTFTRDECAEN